MRTVAFIASVIFFLSFAFVVAQGGTIVVPGDLESPDQPTIQGAIDSAANGDTILVMPGTYYETIDFSGKAVTVKSCGGAELTTIDGSEAGSVVTFQNGEGAGSVLWGFTITGGLSSNGGGINCTGFSNPTLLHNIIENNKAENSGGGVYCINSSPDLKWNTIKNNTASNGAGLYTGTLSNTSLTCNLITDNSASYGGGGIYCFNSGPELQNNTFSGNAAEFGGGLFCTYYASPSITNCIFWNDESYNDGNEFWIGTSAYPSTVTIDYSDVSYSDPSDVFTDSGCTLSWGSNMITSNPLFTSDSRGDYFLSQVASGQGSDSPCLDAGDPGTAFLEGSTRTDWLVDGGVQDMGYHYYPVIVVPDHYSTIQGAVDASYAWGVHTILVRPGIYTENLDLPDHDCTVMSEEGPEVTTIDGGGMGRVVEMYIPSPQCLVLQGFTITNGNGESGGGIRCIGETIAVVSDNMITGNTADTTGGGIHCGGTRYRKAVIGNVIFGNSSDSGGGVFAMNAFVVGNSIYNNDANWPGSLYDGYGGGIATGGYAIITDNTIYGNRAGYRGGGISGISGFNVVKNNIVSGNSAGRDGGGLEVIGTSGWDPIITNNLIIDNLAGTWDTEGYGGGVIFFDVDLPWTGHHFNNNTIVGNQAKTAGGGMHVDNGCQIQMSNCIVRNNEAQQWGDEIFIGSEADPSTVDAVYCHVPAAGVYTVYNCEYLVSSSIMDDPLFAAGPLSDYYLSQISAGQAVDSPCVDAGESGGADSVCTEIFWAPNWNKCMSQFTTRTDQDYDAGDLDIGFHHTPAGVIYVPDDYSTIQAAIDAASDGDIVIVRSDVVHGGPYSENIDFLGKAVVVRSEEGADATTIDGGGTGSVVTFSNGEGPLTVLQGFTLTNGSAAADGGGILCDGASPAIVNNRIVDNTATYTGGGIYCENGADPLITGNTIMENTSTNLHGGGIGVNGSSPVISGNTVKSNTASSRGGGIFVAWGSGATVVNNLVTHNEASVGGGINCWYTTLVPVLSSNTIADNTATSEGGGLYCRNSSPVVTDSIVWGNSPEAINVYTGSSPDVSYCDVEGGWAGTGNIDVDPLFVVPGYYLGQTAAGQSVTSPCVDVGSLTASESSFPGNMGLAFPSHLTTRTDGTGDGGQLDMGFHNAGAQIAYDAYIWNPSGSVSGSELSLALSSIGATHQSGADIPSDSSVYSMMFVCLGVDSSRHILSVAEGDALAGFLDGGGSLYMEGSDTWGNDFQTAAHPYFTIVPNGDGFGDCGPVLGAGKTRAHGMSFTYSGGNSFMDRLSPGSGAFVFTRNGNPEYDNCIAYDGGSYRTIGCAYEFGGLLDGSSPSTKEELLAVYLDFFENGFVPMDTVEAEMTCLPCSGSLPFSSTMTARMTNLHPSMIRRLAGRINVTVASGRMYTSWRAGYTNLEGGASYFSPWAQAFPALETLVGTNQFEMVVMDVTPIPFNQPPNPPAGDAASDSVAIVGLVP